MYDYLIYDFDGTISDTYPVFAKALIELLNRHDIKGDYKTAYNQLKVSVGYALKQYDISDETRKEYKEIHRELAIAEQCAFPEAEEILKFAKDNGKKNYIYTHTGSLVHKLLEKMKLTGYFEFVLDGSYGFLRKPAPDALNYLIEKCGIDRSRAIMIGDRDIDAEAAKNAGIAGCLIDSEGYYPDCVTDHYIKSLSELKKII